MSSANSESLFLLFQSGFLLFLFLLWLLWPKLPKLCWIVVVRVGTLILFLTLGAMLSIFLPLRIMFAVGLSYMAFIMLRYVPSMPAFWRVFYHKWVLNFVKGFLCNYWDNHIVFILQIGNVWLNWSVSHWLIWKQRILTAGPLGDFPRYLFNGPISKYRFQGTEGGN